MKKFILTLILLAVFAPVSFACKDIDVSFDDGIYLIKLHGKKVAKKIKFVSNDSLITNKEAHILTGSRLTINAGYFDPKNQKTISYIVTDRETVEDPMLNENLLANKVLRQNIDKILNRTEFRVVECDNKFHYEIVPHKNSVDFGCNIITSAQGGPLIYPQMRLEEEFFVVKDSEGNVIRESCSVLHKVARTVIGIKDGEVQILIITDKHPMNLYEVRDYVKDLGWDRAMTFDGGSSTSMDYLKEIHVVSTEKNDTGRSLKSFMVVK